MAYRPLHPPPYPQHYYQTSPHVRPPMMPQQWAEFQQAQRQGPTPAQRQQLWQQSQPQLPGVAYPYGMPSVNDDMIDYSLRTSGPGGRGLKGTDQTAINLEPKGGRRAGASSRSALMREVTSRQTPPAVASQPADPGRQRARSQVRATKEHRPANFTPSTRFRPGSVPAPAAHFVPQNQLPRRAGPRPATHSRRAPPNDDPELAPPERGRQMQQAAASTALVQERLPKKKKAAPMTLVVDLNTNTVEFSVAPPTRSLRLPHLQRPATPPQNEMVPTLRRQSAKVGGEAALPPPPPAKPSRREAPLTTVRGHGHAKRWKLSEIRPD
jgi:hypothetical protein